MIKSMTGFGRGEASGSGKRVTIEAKAVNHRYAEVIVRLPRIYGSLEEGIKKIFSQAVARGRVDIAVNIEAEATIPQVSVDKDLAHRYYHSLRDLAENLDIPCDLSVSSLVNLPGVIQVVEPQEDLEGLMAVAGQAAEQALALLLKMRQQEGASLLADLQGRLAIVRNLLHQVEERAPQIPSGYQQRILDRLQELLQAIPVDEQRVAMEVALLADRANVTEEIVRLHSHLEQFDQTLQSDEPVGRKLDFLLQEMNREVNTIGSKANDLELTRYVVAMKSEMEKIREQVQNIE
ncbi:YicC/YloC family endoribonuclease [Heliophilum fasciatum]|uniref:Uncharacterized protein (TIGR00255 family) n=1 Tax=Heliophilum fasciatum TaxID=35700 RepID=A0A4R2RYJ9_9FIRM|nr:YicC/YloC family endoribonuclease [Heliophilum fasciatum]MCW2277216.1 uncharacterized protein (TIGR00255 family) [Heliophilum fasciatum]TCP68149.1 uncharacterized protein (TIGR00255 family) [Heliophilum fasciatum]